MIEATNNACGTGLEQSGTSAPSFGSFGAQTHNALHRCFTAFKDVLIRVGLLFAMVCLIKAVMLASFRKYLFATYWRTESRHFSWINYAVFFLFALLVGLTLWKLAKRYEQSGRRIVRPVNTFVLVLGGLFIALSFHEGDKNHLHPVLNGVFGWKDLWPYYSLNFFFRPPFLSIWMAAYAATYYWLKRTARERFILRATAVFATAYTLLCLGDLLIYREELVLASVFGVACLLTFRHEHSRMNLLWVFLPLGFIAIFYFAFGAYTSLLSSPQPECVVIIGWSFVVIAGTTLLAWQRGFLAGWLRLVPFAGVSFLLFLNANYPASANYRNLMCVALTIPRYFMGELGLALVLLAAAACYRRWRPAGSLLWLDIINVGLIALALMDLRLSQVMGTRLDWDALSLALGEGPKMIWCMAQPYLPAVAGLLAGIVVIYVCALSVISRLSRRQDSSSFIQRTNIEYPIILCVLLGLAGRLMLGNDKLLAQTVGALVQTSPLWRNASSPAMDETQFTGTARRLGMEQLVTAPTPPASGQTVRDLNVVFVLLESSYNKYLSLFNGKEETQPLLSQYKERMELFPNFYSSFAGSINAQFANFTGLYPVRDYKEFTLNRVSVKSIFEVLHENGYATSLFTSTYLDYTGFRDFLSGRNVDEMFDADNMPGAQKAKQVSWGLREEETLAAMQQQVRKYAAVKQKFFITYVPVAPHYPYDGTPERFRKYRPHKYKDFTPYYLNELLYMDWIITSIVDELRDTDLLDKTLIVITGDHGEMLGADGGHIGHGWALTPELANVPLIIMDPGKRGYQVNKTVGSQVDLLPTILDALGISCPPDQLYQGVSLYSTNASADRVIYLNTFRQYAVIQGHNLFFGDRDVKSGGGGDNHSTAFTMQNEGARTSFVEMQTPIASPFSMSDFDAFQENVIHNYSRYREMMRPTNTASSSK